MRAKTFMATIVFEKFCGDKSIEHIAINEFCSHMKLIAVTVNIPKWDRLANKLAITGLGDALPGNTPKKELVNDITTNIREISASAIYGVHKPKTTSLYLNKVLRVCSYKLDREKIRCFESHRMEADGWGLPIENSRYSEWENAL